MSDLYYGYDDPEPDYAAERRLREARQAEAVRRAHDPARQAALAAGEPWAAAVTEFDLVMDPARYSREHAQTVLDCERRKRDLRIAEEVVAQRERDHTVAMELDRCRDEEFRRRREREETERIERAERSLERRLRKMGLRWLERDAPRRKGDLADPRVAPGHATVLVETPWSALRSGKLVRLGYVCDATGVPVLSGQGWTDEVGHVYSDAWVREQLHQ